MRVTVTANYPESDVREILLFAAKHVELNHAALRVKVKNSTGTFRGMAYRVAYTSADYNAGAKGLVTLGIGTPDKFPFTSRSCGELRDWKEALVFLAAHEFSHQVDFKSGKKSSEVTANRDGRTAVAAYRLTRSIGE